MTCPGLLYQKKSKENGVSDSNITTEKDMLKALDYYFHLVTTTGKAGVYIKKRISPYHMFGITGGGLFLLLFVILLLKNS